MDHLSSYSFDLDKNKFTSALNRNKHTEFKFYSFDFGHVPAEMFENYLSQEVHGDSQLWLKLMLIFKECGLLANTQNQSQSGPYDVVGIKCFDKQVQT